LQGGRADLVAGPGRRPATQGRRLRPEGVPSRCTQPGVARSRPVEVGAGSVVTEPGPLAGLLVADFSRVLAGPLATMTLGDLGADVIKVERPGVGDDTRGWGPPFAPNGQATYFLSVNRNKRSLAVDLSTVEGQAAALELALEADILVENFPP